MDLCQWPWYQLLFQNKFRHSFGDEFDRLFKSIMARRYPADFQKVKPAGRHGDRKCDGLLVSRRMLFQCYGPERLQTQPTIKKIDEDFPGAIPHWGADFEHWVFVHNQWRDGLPPEVTKRLRHWDGQFSKTVGQWCEIEMGNQVYGLQPPDLIALFGPPFDPRAIRDVGFDQLRQVLEHVATSSPADGGPVQPVPRGKVEFNNLSAEYHDWLNIGRRKQRVIEHFFNKWPQPELGQRIAQTFKQRYEALRDAGFKSDAIFGELWSFAGGGRFAPNMSLENAVLSLLGFLFDQCDIFEAPTADWAQ